MTGAGGDGGPRGTRLCLNFGGSIGSEGASTILITRFVAPDACAELGVYFMYVGSFLSATARSRAPCAEEAFPLASACSASRVRSEFSASAALDGLSKSSALIIFSETAAPFEWTTFPSRCPTLASTSCRALPVPQVVNAKTCDDSFPFFPICMRARAHRRLISLAPQRRSSGSDPDSTCPQRVLCHMNLRECPSPAEVSLPFWDPALPAALCRRLVPFFNSWLLNISCAHVNADWCGQTEGWILHLHVRGRGPAPFHAAHPE